MTFKTTTVTIPLYGHGLESAGNVAIEPRVPGVFTADPVTGNDGEVFGVFTISDPTAESGALPYPSAWAGTYRISASRLKAEVPSVFTSL